MRLLLLKDIQGQGKKGQVIDVSDGYGKNFILKNKLGILTTDPQAKKMLKEMDEALAKKKREAERMTKLKYEIERKPLSIVLPRAKDGKVYGSVKEKEIASGLEHQFGVTLDKHNVKLKNAIKAEGNYTAEVDLGFGVKTIININAQ